MTLSSVITTAAGEVSEIAIRVKDAAAFWASVLELLQRTIGFDAAYLASTKGDVARSRLVVFGHDDATLRQQLPSLLADLSPEDVAKYTGAARTAEQIWGRGRRRDQLRLFDRFYGPLGTKDVLVRVDWCADRLVGLTLERRGSTRPFTDRAAMILDALAPTIALGDRVVSVGPNREIFTAEFGLTRRETDVAELVLRGLRNAEIAALLSTSPNTIRNILVAVFRKADVTNRAELAYVVSEAVQNGTSSVLSRDLCTFIGYARDAGRARRV